MSLLCLLLASDVTEAGKGKCGGRWAIHACRGGNGKRNIAPVKSAFDTGEKIDALGQGADYDTGSTTSFASPTQRRYYHLPHQQQTQFGDGLRKIYRLKSDASGPPNSQWDPERRRTLAEKKR